MQNGKAGLRAAATPEPRDRGHEAVGTGWEKTGHFLPGTTGPRPSLDSGPESLLPACPGKWLSSGAPQMKRAGAAKSPKQL